MAKEIYTLVVSADVDKAEAAVKRLGNSLNQSSREADAAGALLSRLDTITLSAIIDQVRGIAEALGTLTAPAVTFEQSMADLAAITGSTGEELEDLSRTARDVGKSSGLGAAESARAFAILAGQIDLPIDALKGLQRETVTLARAGALPLEEAANAVAGTINQFGLEASQAARVVNVLAAGSRAGGAEVVDLSESFKVAGAAAHAAGVSLEETAGALEVLAQNNTKGAEAGTAMRNMLIAMQTGLGIDVSQSGFAGGLRIIQAEMERMGGQTERTAFLAKAFGRENLVAAQYLLANADAVEEMTASVTDTQAAIEQAEIRNDTWAHKMEVAKARMDELRISLVEMTGGLLPFGALLGEQLVPLAELTPLITSVGGAVKSLGATLRTSGLGGIAIAIGAITASLIVAYKSSEDFRRACDELFAEIKALGGAIMRALKPAFEALLSALKPLIPMLGQLFTLLAHQLAEIIRRLAPLLEPVCRILGLIVELLAPIIGLVVTLAGRILEALMPALEPLFRIFAGNNIFVKLFGEILSGVCVVVETLVGWITKLIDGLRELIGLGDRAQELSADKSAPHRSATSPSTTQTTQTTPTATHRPLITIPTIPTSSAADKRRKEEITDLETIEGLQNAITKAQEQLNRAKGETAVALQQEINRLQEELDKLQSRIKKAAEPLVKIQATGITDIRDYHAASLKQAEQDGRETRSGRILAMLPGTQAWERELETFQKKVNKITLDHLKREAEKWRLFVSDIQAGLGGVSSTMSSMGDIVGGAAGSWLRWGAGVVDAISEVLPKLLALFNANVATAASGAASSQASIPVVGPMMAVAGVASVLAAIAHPPKATAFASGGILYGPTYALAGEYPGAANNPEVIAPLDRLPALLGTDRQTQTAGEVSFKIRGRELIGILNKELKTTKLS